MANRESSSFSDADIMRAIVERSYGRRPAETQLFTRYSYLVRQGMYKHSLDEDDAFSAYCDTVLQVIDNLEKGSFGFRSSLKSYLYKIFQNKCVDLIRKKTTHKSSVHRTAAMTEMLDMIADKGKTVIQQLIDKTDMDLLQRRLDELTGNCKEMLALFSEGYTDKEIAAIMTYKSADVVKTSRLRCLDRLRSAYKRKTT